jgi:hypothetical protein
MEYVNKCVIVRLVDKMKDHGLSREDGTRIMKEIYDPEKYGLVEKPRPKFRPFWETANFDKVTKTLVSVSPTKPPSKLSSVSARNRFSRSHEKSPVSKMPVLRFLLPQLRSPFPRFQ